MGLVRRSQQPASPESAQRWSVWSVRLLVVVLVLQIAVVAFFMRGAGLLGRGASPPGPNVEVVPAAGTQRPNVPKSVNVRSYTHFYVDDKQIPYSPEDLTDGVEYAVNYLTAHPDSNIRIVRTVTVVRGRR